VQVQVDPGKALQVGPQVWEWLNGPRHSVEPGASSREGDMARAAPACERYRRHASRPNQAGGTCTYDNPAGSRPAALARSLRMTSTWSATCLCSGVLSWADSPVAAGRSVKAKDQRTGLPGGAPGGRRCHRRQAAGPTPQLIGAGTVGAIPGALEELLSVVSRRRCK